MEFFIVWCVLAVLVGVAAGQRGRSGIGFFVLSMVVSPLAGGLFLALMPNLAPPPVPASGARGNEQRQDEAGAAVRPVAVVSVADELEKLSALQARGVLTKDEFDAAKARLLR